jgi:hypothetical protein
MACQPDAAYLIRATTTPHLTIGPLPTAADV